MLGTGYFLKIAKKLVPAKHKKSPIRKTKLSQKFRATRYCVYCDSYDKFSNIAVTSVNLKKAGMASRNIVMKKQYTLF